MNAQRNLSSRNDACPRPLTHGRIGMILAFLLAVLPMACKNQFSVPPLSPPRVPTPTPTSTVSTSPTPSATLTAGLPDTRTPTSTPTVSFTPTGTWFTPTPTDTVNPLVFDARIMKSILGPDSGIGPGQPITFVLETCNLGPDHANPVTLRDFQRFGPVPGALQFDQWLGHSIGATGSMGEIYGYDADAQCGYVIYPTFPAATCHSVTLVAGETVLEPSEECEERDNWAMVFLDWAPTTSNSVTYHMACPPTATPTPSPTFTHTPEPYRGDCASPVTMGNDLQNQSSMGLTFGIASSFFAPSDGVVTRLFVQAYGKCIDLRVGLYDNSGATGPGNRLTASGLFQLGWEPSTWFEADVQPVTVTSGQRYWIVAAAQEFRVHTRSEGGANRRYFWTGWTGSLPEVMPVLADHDNQLCAFAEICTLAELTKLPTSSPTPSFIFTATSTYTDTPTNTFTKTPTFTRTFTPTPTQGSPTPTWTGTVCPSLVLNAGQHLDLDAGTYCYSFVDLEPGSSLGVSGVVVLDVQNDFNLWAGATILGSYKGYQNRGSLDDPGPGAGDNSGYVEGAGGGGHGGMGGAGMGGPLGGAVNDSSVDPVLAGSAGGRIGTGIYPGGSGGAALVVHAPNGIARVQGSLFFDGALGSTVSVSDVGASGGGAGGTVNIRASVITGGGVISATGGQGGYHMAGGNSGGGGGGGRVALCATDLYDFYGYVQVFGGMPGGGTAGFGSPGSFTTCGPTPTPAN